jgi:hypothetical protein
VASTSAWPEIWALASTAPPPNVLQVSTPNRGPAA